MLVSKTTKNLMYWNKKRGIIFAFITMFETIFLTAFCLCGFFEHFFSILILFFVFDFFILLCMKVIVNEKNLKSFIYEQLDVVKKTKIDNNDKVVWAIPVTDKTLNINMIKYNLKQSYRNVQIWFIENIVDDIRREELYLFAKKKGIKVFSVGAKAKLPRFVLINRFLKYSGADYDYFVTSKPDEILDHNFILYSLKFFHSDIATYLGYICPIAYCFGGKNLYSNSVKWHNDVYAYKHFNQSYLLGKNAWFDSETFMVKKELLMQMGNSFPENDNEKEYIFDYMSKNDWTGLNIIVAPVKRFFKSSYESTVNKFNERVATYAYLFKNQPYLRYNKASSINFGYRMKFLFITPFTSVLYIFLVTAAVFLVDSYIGDIKETIDPHNTHFIENVIIYIITATFLLLIFVILLVYHVRVVKFPQSIWYSICIGCFYLSIIWKSLFTSIRLISSKKSVFKKESVCKNVLINLAKLIIAGGLFTFLIMFWHWRTLYELHYTILLAWILCINILALTILSATSYFFLKFLQLLPCHRKVDPEKVDKKVHPLNRYILDYYKDNKYLDKKTK